MKYFIFVMILTWGFTSSAQSSLIPQIRQYIKIYEQHYPRTELFTDVLKMQSHTPEEKATLNAPNNSNSSGKLHQIYDNHQVQFLAQSIANKMDPRGPFNNQYAETVQELLQIYIREPQHRRAVQSLFDIITLTYHDNTQKEKHHDRMTSWTQHLLDYAEWTWGVAALWSLRTNPAFINNQKWYLKPISAPLKLVPIPKFMSTVYKNKAATSIHQSPWLVRMGHYIGKKPVFRAIGEVSKNMATLAGVTFGTAALLGTPSYFLYQYNLWPFKHKENPEDLLGKNLHQMALLNLGCRVVDLAQDIEHIEFDSLDMDSFLDLSRQIKIEINDLVDARRYLYEVAYFYNTSQRLSSEITWNPNEAQFSFRGETLTCESLKGQSIPAIENGLINLNSMNRILNTEIKNFTEKSNRFLFKHKENLISEFVNQFNNQFRNQFQKYQGTVATQSLQKISKLSSEDIESSVRISLLSLAYVGTQQQSLFQVDEDFISKIPRESEDLVLIANLLDQYIQKMTLPNPWSKMSSEIQTLTLNLAKNIVYEWPNEVFNPYVLHILENHFVKNPQDRLAIAFLFINISEVLNEEIKKNIIPDIEQYIDPVIFTLPLLNTQASENSLANETPEEL